MTDDPKLEDIMGSAKIEMAVSDGLQHSSTQSDSFVVDMERFSHFIEKDINAHSRITLQRNLSRKGTAKTVEKKVTAIDRDTPLLAISPRATLHGTPEKAEAAVVAVGATDHSITAQVHHQITISNGSLSGGVLPAAESKLGGRRFSFRRSPATLTINPKRIFLFFATLSCMGTIVLIYFTLSMVKLNGEDDALN